MTEYALHNMLSIDRDGRIRVDVAVGVVHAKGHDVGLGELCLMCQISLREKSRTMMLCRPVSGIMQPDRTYCRW